MATDPGTEGGVTARVINQINTKTVGPPQAATGLTGDKAPANIITVEQIDQVRNQMNLELVNIDAFEKLNTVTTVTNTSSNSGPIVGTMKIVTASSDGSLVTIFRPDNTHEVWEVNALSQTRTNATGSTTTAVYITDDNGNLVMIEELADNSGAFPLNVASQQPFRISYENYLVGAYSPSANADAVNFFCSVVRVR